VSDTAGPWPWKWDRSLTDYIPKRSSFRDITGQRFGGLVALYPLGYIKNNCRWMFRCDCGADAPRFVAGVLNGKVKSCGCSSNELRRASTSGTIKQNAKWDPTKTDFVPTGGRFVDETGNTYGNLAALYPIGILPNRDDNYVVWRWSCSCGGEVDATSYDVKRRHVTSCGCGRCGQSASAWTGYQEIPGKVFISIPRDAARRGYEFHLTKEFMWDLFIRQGRKCALSGIPLRFLDEKTGKVSITASLDRIDSSGHYTEDNVQWVHKDVNWMKNRFSQERFLDLCTLIAANNLKSSSGFLPTLNAVVIDRADLQQVMHAQEA